MELTKKWLFMIVVVSLLVGGGVTAATLELLDEPNEQASPSNEQEKENEEESESNSEEKEQEGDEEFPDLDVLSYTMNVIEDEYVKEISREELLEGALEGIVNKLGDPYSEYMDADTMEEFQSQIESSFEGIGAEVTKRDNYITIISPIKNTPAEEAGLRANDRVIEVDGESLEGMNVYEAVSLIRGEKGTDVTLTINRPGEEEPFDVVITRDTIPVTTVYSEVEEYNDQKVGVLEIRSFSEKTSQEFSEQLKKLEDEENIDGLVIDVRGNPGGLLNSVQEILGNFLTQDDPFMQVSVREGEPQPYYLNESGNKDYPISVLTNEGSASASEILAAAMKEVGGYEVVGKTTFGKGTVQQTMEVGDGLLKLTVMNWLDPNGEKINEVGVEPTVEVEQPEFFYTSLIQTEEPLKYDNTGQEVVKAQIMLEGLGYEPGRTDGYFNEQTQGAVERFQQQNDLEVTGTVNEETEAELEKQILEAVDSTEQDEQLQKAMEVLFN